MPGCAGQSAERLEVVPPRLPALPLRPFRSSPGQITRRDLRGLCGLAVRSCGGCRPVQDPRHRVGDPVRAAPGRVGQSVERLEVVPLRLSALPLRPSLFGSSTAAAGLDPERLEAVPECCRVSDPAHRARLRRSERRRHRIRFTPLRRSRAGSSAGCADQLRPRRHRIPCAPCPAASIRAPSARAAPAGSVSAAVALDPAERLEVVPERCPASDPVRPPRAALSCAGS